MRQYMLALSVILVLTVNAAAPKIVIYAEGDVDNAQKNVVLTAMVNAIIEDGNFTPLERDRAFLNSVQREISHQYSGNLAEGEVRKLTEQFGAEYIFSVELSNLYGELYGRTRIFNFVTNVVLATAEYSRSVRSIDDLRIFASKLANFTIEKLPANKQRREQEKQENERRLKAEQEKLNREKDVKQYIAKFELIKVATMKDAIDDIKYYHKSSIFRFAQFNEIKKYLECCKLLGDNSFNYYLLIDFSKTITETYFKNSKMTKYELYSCKELTINNNEIVYILPKKPVYYYYDNYHKRIDTNGDLTDTYILIVRQ